MTPAKATDRMKRTEQNGRGAISTMKDRPATLHRWSDPVPRRSGRGRRRSGRRREPGWPPLARRCSARRSAGQLLLVSAGRGTRSRRAREVSGEVVVQEDLSAKEQREEVAGTGIVGQEAHSQEDVHEEERDEIPARKQTSSSQRSSTKRSTAMRKRSGSRSSSSTAGRGRFPMDAGSRCRVIDPRDRSYPVADSPGDRGTAMGLREERVAKNEAAARKINEQIEQAVESIPPGSFMHIICEWMTRATSSSRC